MKGIRELLIVLIAVFTVNVSAGNGENGSSGRPHKRIKWTKFEDDLLMAIIGAWRGDIRWPIVAAQFNVAVNDLARIRKPRACRDRYLEQLSGGIDRHFSKEEDEMLIKYVNDYGNKWSCIAKFFTNKSADVVKNRYARLLRRGRDSNCNVACGLHCNVINPSKVDDTVSGADFFLNKNSENVKLPDGTAVGDDTSYSIYNDYDTYMVVFGDDCVFY